MKLYFKYFQYLCLFSKNRKHSYFYSPFYFTELILANTRFFLQILYVKFKETNYSYKHALPWLKVNNQMHTHAMVFHFVHLTSVKAL
jgi:hypothetical protein